MRMTTLLPSDRSGDLIQILVLIKQTLCQSEQFSQLLDPENFGMTVTKDGAGLFDAGLRFGIQMGSTLLYVVDFQVIYLA